MTDPKFYLETPRLYITYFRPDDVTHCNFLVQLYNTPEFIASIGGKPTSITTVERARAQLKGRFQAEHARNGYGTYLISLKPESTIISRPSEVGVPVEERLTLCKPIGTVSLMRGEGPDSYTAPDLGFAILPEQTRKGYAKEAATKLLSYARNILGVDSVLGLFDPQNEASRGVFRSLGFEDRGVWTLKAFGGVQGAVWTLPGMAEDLSEYGI